MNRLAKADAVCIRFVMTTMLFVAVAYAAGVITTVFWFRQQIRIRDEEAGELERDIIRSAIQHGGRITALDVRSRSADSLQAVEVRLRALHTAGYCESELDEDSRSIYVFPAFDEAPMRALRLEKQALSLARRTDGLVHVSSLTVETDLSYAEARDMLEKMSKEGMCERTETPDTFRFFSEHLRPRRTAKQ